MNSRVIKFRAFDTQRNVMYSAAELGRDEMQLHPDGRGFFNASSVSQRLSQYYSHLLPMQFTGLHDKNGKEIYEGDIVLEGITRKVILWRHAAFHVEVPNWKPHADMPTRPLWMDMLSPEGIHFEVIGNIYENPELLQ